MLRRKSRYNADFIKKDSDLFMNLPSVNRSTAVFWLFFVCAIALDQSIKLVILSGFRWDSAPLSIILVLNKGAAFSLFAFLGERLKYIQAALVLTAIAYVFWDGLIKRHSIPLGILLGAGCSNLLDRFVHGGVVDYVFWHYGFEFAVFNVADALIDCSIVWIIYSYFKKPKIAA
ncbi:MAG: signal peptidase II [Helicobacteraceae bacterium]|jgi:signal peptidase II|nr:signal peptidase II [Helicobacteraceae bacterium]